MHFKLTLALKLPLQKKFVIATNYWCKIVWILRAEIIF